MPDVGNVMIDTIEIMVREAQRILDGGAKRGRVPELWDARAAPGIGAIIEAFVRMDRTADNADHDR